MRKLAAKFREQGLVEAADEIEVFAEQEEGHGALIQSILDQGDQNVDTTGKDVYVCGACGYEYVGDLDAEPDDFVCPVCGLPKKVFRKKAAEA